MTELDDRKPAAVTVDAVDAAADQDSSEDEAPPALAPAVQIVGTTTPAASLEQQTTTVEPTAQAKQAPTVTFAAPNTPAASTARYFAPTSQTGQIAQWCSSDAFIYEHDNQAALNERAMIIDMLNATHLLQQENRDLLVLANKGYTNVPPDPCYFLARLNGGQLVLLYGFQQCNQLGSAWQSKTVVFVGDPSTPNVVPLVWVPKRLADFAHGNLTVSALTTITNVTRATRNGPTSQRELPVKLATSRAAREYPIVTMVKIPPLLLAQAFAAGDPQQSPLNFMLPILNFVQKWTAQANALPEQGYKRDKMLTCLKNSLLTMVTQNTAMRGTVQESVGVNAAMLELSQDSLYFQPPDVHSTNWAIANWNRLAPQQQPSGVQQPPQVQPFAAVQQPAAGVKQPPPVPPFAAMQQPAAGVQQPPQVQPFTAVQQPAAGVQQPPPQVQPFTAVQQPAAGVQQPPPQDHPFTTVQQPAAGVQQPPPFPSPSAVQQPATGVQRPSSVPPLAAVQQPAPGGQQLANAVQQPVPAAQQPAAAQQPHPVPPFAGMQQPSGGQPHSFHQPPGLQYPFAAPPPTTFGSPAAAAAGPRVWGTYAPPPPGLPAGPAPDPCVWGPRPPAPPGPPVAPTWWPQQPAYGPGFPPAAPLQETPGASKDTAMYTIIMPTLCALMGFTFIPADPVQQGMPSFLPQLAQASAKGPGLMALFRNGIQSLTSSPDNNTFFQGFNVSPTLHKELQSFQYSIDDPQTDWHKGLGPGVAMSRDRQAVLDRKRLYEQINTFGGMGITMGRLGDTKLETPTPSLPRTYQEFLFFLTRYGKILLTWLTPNCALYRLVAALSTEVLNYNRHATYPDHWYWENGPFILWKLVLEAKNFFDQSRSHETFLSLGPIRFATEPHLAARDLIRDAKTGLSQTELPGPFQQLLNYSVPSRPTPPVQFNPGGQMAPPVQPSPARQAPPAQASGPPSGRGSSTTPSNRQSGVRNGTPPTTSRRNPHAAQVLVSWFANLSQDPTVPPFHRTTRRIHTAMGQTVEQSLQALGLEANQCLNFHLRGSCQSQRCRKRHDGTPLAQAAVTQMEARLNAALPNLRN